MTEVSLDRVDLRILDILQADAGLSNQDLADRVGVSPATCLRRVKRMTDVGVLVRSRCWIRSDWGPVCR